MCAEHQCFFLRSCQVNFECEQACKIKTCKFKKILCWHESVIAKTLTYVILVHRSVGSEVGCDGTPALPLSHSLRPHPPILTLSSLCLSPCTRVRIMTSWRRWSRRESPSSRKMPSCFTGMDDAYHYNSKRPTPREGNGEKIRVSLAGNANILGAC